jgi:acyl dehydratase
MENSETKASYWSRVDPRLSIVNRVTPLLLDQLGDVDSLSGVDLGVSRWRTIDQRRISDFAAVTEDHTPIHVDDARALAAGLPSTIAHGMLTLSLGPALLGDLLTIGGGLAGLNYGFERVRFVRPVLSGSRLRLRAKVEAVAASGDERRVSIAETFELEAPESEPVCFALAIIHLDQHPVHANVR